MAIAREVIEIIEVLVESGFGFVAGEILQHISSISYSGGVLVVRHPEVEMQEDLQFSFALSYIIQRIAVPSVKFSESEYMAGGLIKSVGDDSKEITAVKVVFQSRLKTGELTIERKVEPGDKKEAERIIQIINKIIQGDDDEQGHQET